MMQKLRKYFGAVAYAAIIISLLIIEGCASIGNPSGGPRDERPPRFLSSSPAPGSTDVPITLERINLQFDELVNVKDAFSKVIVSPPGRAVPRVSSQGHRVTVQFSDTLLPNTTYTIDFADAIEDNNEGNRLENFAYSFSTGPTIDSLRIAGRVLSARDLEPMQQKLVGIHRIPDRNYAGTASDTARISSSPLSFLESVNRKLFIEKFYRVARTDDRGRFSIEGLPAGKYRVYALDDTNSDYLFTNADEEVGVCDIVVSPTVEESVANDTIFNLKTGLIDSISLRRRSVYLPNDIIIRNFLSSRKQQFISKYDRTDTTRLNIIFNAPMAELPELKIDGMKISPETVVTERSAGNDTISLWLKDRRLIDRDTIWLSIAYPQLDSVQKYVIKEDSLRFTSDRTRLRAEAEKARKEIEKKQKKDSKKNSESQEETVIKTSTPLLNISILSAATQDIRRPVIIESPEPIARFNPDGIHLEMKRDTVWQHIPMPEIIMDSLNQRRLIIAPEKWDLGTEYRVTADSLAIEGLYGLFNGPKNYDFKTKTEKEYSSLTLTIPDWPTDIPAFVELLNGSDKIADTAPLIGSTVRFQYITPGKYYARIVADYNGNGKWDTGDPLTDREPDISFYYPKALNIKANWNKEETWNVFDTPVDRMKPETLLKNKPTQTNKGNGRRQKTTNTDDEDEEE